MIYFIFIKKMWKIVIFPSHHQNLNVLLDLYLLKSLAVPVYVCYSQTSAG